ncbi:hypothetical protein JCM8547_005667 [Rhodosporidiobolus lusitaniae]
MTREGDLARKFKNQHGDELLKRALETVEVMENASTHRWWTNLDGKKVSYTNALAESMNTINQTENLGAPVFSPEDVRKRLHSVDNWLKARNEWNPELLVNLRRRPISERIQQLAPPPVAGYDDYQYGGEAGSAGQEHDSWYDRNHGVLPTLQPPYNGPSGPSNPYNNYYRSLGHGSSGHFARPLRHAVIYGEGRSRF